MQHIYILGSRGLPVGYSGYETFVLKLTEYSKNMPDIKYHVACRGKGENGSSYNNAERFYIQLPPIGAAKAVIYDIIAALHCIKDIKKNKYQNACIYILACRIGPFMKFIKKRCVKLGIKIAINPDGHEWMRGKWNAAIKKYWKFSEKLMVKHADLMICDAKEMERYIREEYKEYMPCTTYISYGADEEIQYCDDKTIDDWYKKFGTSLGNYYLIVGRFIPENNYELMIREFMKSDTKKDLILITDVSNNAFYERLVDSTNFVADSRIKFVGTVFDRPLINRIRRQAFIYFHGHEVGGTNPSLLEAMACKCAICAVDVRFSREVLDDNGLYFKKKDGYLCKMIQEMEQTGEEELHKVREANYQRVREFYNWECIAKEYKDVWNGSK